MIIVYGGSFDPPHLGHLNIVKTLKVKFKDAFKILIYPNAISPLKVSKSLTTHELLELCQVTFQEVLDEQVELKDYEIGSSNPSYTINTIQHILTQFPEERIWLCIGEDSLTSLTSWYKFEELLNFVEKFIVLRRKTKSPIPVIFPNSEIENKALVLDNDLWEISSSRLREERELEYAKRWMQPKALEMLQSMGWFS